jgi:tetratricopeptide (TPR) repeat protein
MALVKTSILLLAILSLAAQAGGTPVTQHSNPEPAPEAFSLLGRPLYPPPIPAETEREMLARLAEARARHTQAPGDPEAIIWLGRRTAYLGRYREAIVIYSRGLEKHPAYAKLYRHRGHRFITIRRLDLAIADFERAATLIRNTPDEVEPDGLPNARNIPTSTSHSNIWYHLGLAYYLSGDFENALRCYRECEKFSKNPDMLVATGHWLYMTLRRLGRTAEAAKVLEPIAENLDVIENGDYHRLLLMYKGKLSAEALVGSAGDGPLAAATVGYGVGNWHLYNGRREEALKTFRRVLDGSQWAGFGYIAAEAEVRRAGGQ